MSVTLHIQTPPPAITGQAVTGPGPGPCVPHRCPTTGTSVTPLVPLAQSLGACLALPSPSRWLLRTIRIGYAIQFTRRPPEFRGIRFTSVKAADAPVLRAEIAVLLAKDAIEPVPPVDMGSGLFSPYFIVPKKGGGLRPILDLRVLNRALHKLPAVQDVDAETHFWVRPSPRLVCSDRPEGRVLSCLDPPTTQTIPAIRVRGSGVSVQGPALRAVRHLPGSDYTWPAARPSGRGQIPSFLQAGVPLEQVSRHAVVFTDASTTGWGATYNGHAGALSGVWTGPQLHWHINCLELLAVRLALSRLRGHLQCKDVLVRTDNTATVAYINQQGGLRSRRMSQLARHLLLWSQKHLRSLRAIHIPGVFNRAADELSRAALPGEWRLHPQVVQLIWGRFGAAQVDLFASPETTHCQEFYSLTEATLGSDALAHSWPRGLRKQTLCKIREDEEQVLLVAPYWPNRTWFPELMLLATAPPWPIPLRKDLLSQRRGTLWHPRPDLWKLHVWSLDGTRRF